MSDWNPPFCTNDDETPTCPVCNETNAARVREKEAYFDADAVEAYCAECQRNHLEAQSSVEITFSCPEKVYDGGRDE